MLILQELRTQSRSFVCFVESNPIRGSGVKPARPDNTTINPVVDHVSTHPKRSATCWTVNSSARTSVALGIW